MQHNFGTEIYRIVSPVTAAFLRKGRTLEILGTCLTLPRSASEISDLTGIPLNTVGRYVSRLLDYAILRSVTGNAQSGRRTQKVVATSSRLFIPYENEDDALPDEVVQRLVEMRVDEQVQGLIAAAGVATDNGGVDWGTLIYADRHGSLVVRPDYVGGRTPNLLDEQSPAYLNFYSSDLQLSAGQAKALQRELVALIKKYKGMTGAKKHYTLSAVLAPKPPLKR